MKEPTIKILLLDDHAKDVANSHMLKALENGFGELVSAGGIDTQSRTWVLRSAEQTVRFEVDLVAQDAKAAELLNAPNALDKYDLVLVDNDWEASGIHSHRHGIEMLRARDRKRDVGPILAIYTIADSFKPGYVAEALSIGAHALIKKNEHTHLVNVVLLAVERSRLRELSQRVDGLADEFCDSAKIGPFISSAMRECVRRAALYAPRRHTVLLIGERGTGKTLLAEHIHQRSQRSSGPFFRVDVGQLPRDLIESTLFGHAKGSFTGADRERTGVLDDAKGGTVFIDDFQNVPISVQEKLRMVLEDDHVYYRVGDSQPKRADVRFIIAMNQDPEELQKQGRLHHDVMDRIKSLTINVPALRDRCDDIPELARRLLHEAWKAEHGDVEAPALSTETLHALRTHKWDDNVRGLKIAMQRLAIHLQPHARAVEIGDLELTKNSAASTGTPRDIAFRRLSDLEIRNGTQRQVLDLLLRHAGSVVAVANINKLIGVSSSGDLSPKVMTAVTRLRDRIREQGFTIEFVSGDGGVKGYRLMEIAA